MSTSRPETAVVFAGGEPIDPAGLGALPIDALHVAADGGLVQADILRRTVDVVIGDMDSVDDVRLAAAQADGAEIVRHPRDKDATDLELALQYAIDRGCERVVGLGGRLDHLFGNALLLANAALQGTEVTWMTKDAWITPVRPGSDFEASASPGQVVSLLPVAGRVRGVRTAGLEWELDDETLAAGSTRGISNVVDGERFTVSVADGVLLVVHNRPAG